MQTRHAYLGLTIAGTILPLWQVAPFLSDSGIDPVGFVALLFANPVSSFFAMDVIVSAVVVWVLVLIQGRRDSVPHLWMPLLATLAVGVSSGLPLFLYLRERRLSRDRGAPIG